MIKQCDWCFRDFDCGLGRRDGKRLSKRSQIQWGSVKKP